MKSERILNAMGQIGDDLIEEASISPKSKRQTVGWHKWVAVAACLCLLITGFLCVRYWEKGTPGTLERPLKLNLEGTTLTSSDGTLIYHTDDFENHTIAFTMILNRDISCVYAYMDGENVLRKWVDDEGVSHQLVDQFRLITANHDLEPSVDRTLAEDMLVVTINGEIAQGLPTRAGSYEVQIYYGKLFDEYDYVDKSISINIFGTLIIDCKRFD